MNLYTCREPRTDLDHPKYCHLSYETEDLPDILDSQRPRLTARRAATIEPTILEAIINVTDLFI